jgi:hypothetical protein
MVYKSCLFYASNIITIVAFLLECCGSRKLRDSLKESSEMRCQLAPKNIFENTLYFSKL